MADVKFVIYRNDFEKGPGNPEAQSSHSDRAKV